MGQDQACGVDQVGTSCRRALAAQFCFICSTRRWREIKHLCQLQVFPEAIGLMTHWKESKHVVVLQNPSGTDFTVNSKIIVHSKNYLQLQYIISVQCIYNKINQISCPVIRFKYFSLVFASINILILSVASNYKLNKSKILTFFRDKAH